MRKLLISILALSALIFASPAFAQSPTTRPSVRLNETRVRACLAHQAEIKNKMNNLLRMTSNMLTKFDGVVARAQSFYVSSGKTVANYEELLADVQVKNRLVSAALTNAQEHVSAFDCNSDNPRAEVSNFRDDMQKVKTALKNYRTAIKNLIMAISRIGGTR